VFSRRRNEVVDYSFGLFAFKRFVIVAIFAVWYSDPDSRCAAFAPSGG
jgi:hypothetical protein